MFRLKFHTAHLLSPITQGLIALIIYALIILLGNAFHFSNQIVWNFGLVPLFLYCCINPAIFVFTKLSFAYLPISLAVFSILFAGNFYYGKYLTNNFLDNYVADMFINQLVILAFFLIYIIAALFKGIKYLLENN